MKNLKLPKGFSQPVLLGSGSFGKVYRCRQEELNRWVAIKILDLGRGNRNIDPEFFIHEFQSLSAMEMDGLPIVYEIKREKSRIYIIMQWVPGVSLKHLPLERFSTDEKLGLIGKIISLTASVHKKEFFHGDIKPEHFLISQDQKLWLIDFGMSGKPVFLRKSPQPMIVGSNGFMAPEILQGKTDISRFKADVYSLGKTIETINSDHRLDPFISQLTNFNPEDRPENAVEAYGLWKNFSFTKGTKNPEVEYFIQNFISNVLLKASKERLYSDRQTAYSLATEALERAPDNEEIVSYLSNFPSSGNSRKKTLLTTLAILILMIVGSLVIYYPVEKGQPTKEQANSNSTHQRLTDGFLEQPLSSSNELKLKHEPGDSLPFKASLELKQFPQNGHFKINGMTTDIPEDGLLKVGPGTLKVTWVDPISQNKWEKILEIRPFQKKVLHYDNP